ncbi:LAFE_0F13894g1_1 [Lachancea fermentati]|uniref:LAFE_0F13894g1_1 n=1 Tax=Lachancea fermentati TaxID=4955 RepID=A0A1G4MG07_LACFM|nr:LAFE_0F13894g1_1 [Lachancea fermentati]
MVDETSPFPLSSRYSYHSIFSDVSKTRFNHLATRLLFSCALFVGLTSTILCHSCSTRWEYLLILPVKWVSVYIAFLLIIVTRKNYLHVDSLSYSSVVTQVYGQLVSIKTLVYLLIHTLSAVLTASAVRDCIFSNLDYPALAYYRFCAWFMTSLLYATQHVSFDLDKLSFIYGSQHQHPQRFISSRLQNSLAKCLMLAGVFFFLSPILFYYLTYHGFPGIVVNFKCTIVGLIIFQLWDFVNIAFNAYLSIGCLHKGKPISSLSSTPMETLVTGLSSKKVFTKLTAFQELAYRATSPDLQLRLPIYHTRYRNAQIWPSILRECLVTIQETNLNVSTFMRCLESQKENLKRAEVRGTKNISSYHQDDELFGNKHIVSTGYRTRLPGSPPSSENLSHRITLQNNNIFAGDNKPPSYEPVSFSHISNNPILTQQTTLTTALCDVINQAKTTFNAFFFPTQNDNSSAQISLFDLWRVSKKRRAEKLIPVPVCYAECVISLMGLLIKSLDEDPKGGVVSSVGEVLKIFERSVGALGGFAEWEEPNNSQDNAVPDVVTILYDLSINAFLEVVLKYNELLNSVYLDDDVVKLSKWVLEICNE